MRIGWIGLGNMGIPMAKNLINSRYDLTVYNRTKEKADSLIELGAKLLENPKEVVENADIIITMVSDDQAVKEIYTSSDGILAGLTSGKTVIDMSTISPNTSREIAELCNEKGVKMLDAPVSGSVKPAEEGTLVILVGGDSKTYNQCKPIFDILGKASFHLGENGAGSEAKLAINTLLGIYIQGIAETVLLAEKSGIPRETMMEIISLSAVGSPISAIKTKSIINDQYPAAFALKHASKDLGLAVDMAKEMNINLPLMNTAESSFREAAKEAYGELDIMAILSYLNGR